MQAVTTMAHPAIPIWSTDEVRTWAMGLRNPVLFLPSFRELTGKMHEERQSLDHMLMYYMFSALRRVPITPNP